MFNDIIIVFHLCDKHIAGEWDFERTHRSLKHIIPLAFARHTRVICALSRFPAGHTGTISGFLAFHANRIFASVRTNRGLGKYKVALASLDIAGIVAAQVADFSTLFAFIIRTAQRTWLCQERIIALAHAQITRIITRLFIDSRAFLTSVICAAKNAGLFEFPIIVAHHQIIAFAQMVAVQITGV